MDFQTRWDIIEELGKGGQGTVYRVRDKKRYNLEEEIYPALQDSIAGLPAINTPESKQKRLETLRKAIVDLINIENPLYHSALKVLHEPKDSRDPERAKTRIAYEIQAMYSVSHPNLLKIVDYDSDGIWFVSQYHQKGSLDKNRDIYAGDFEGSLKAFRPLVHAVSEIHKLGLVHRDIKPENVFLAHDGRLVLGDFGSVFFTDSQHTRISATYENVGSRDWMPPWAMGIRIEEIKPCFDVFCLGKLLWAMVSGRPILQLWYYDKEQFNVEEIFPRSKSIKFANDLFSKCIVENETDCIPTASELLEEIDKIIDIIELGADKLNLEIERKCKVCGIGKYLVMSDGNLTRTQNYGLSPRGNMNFMIFECSHCGHVQLFSHKGSLPKAWE